MLLGMLALGSCAINPVSGTPDFVTMSESQEVSIGRSEDKKVREQYGIYDDPALQRYVNDIGQRLAGTSHRSGLQYQFLVVDSPQINAFALPGGYVGVNSGLILATRNESELASVLAHEIGHVTQRHISRMIGQQRQSTGVMMAAAVLAALAASSSPDAAMGLLSLGQTVAVRDQLSFSRDAEREADEHDKEGLAEPDAVAGRLGLQPLHVVARGAPAAPETSPAADALQRVAQDAVVGVQEAQRQQDEC